MHKASIMHYFDVLALLACLTAAQHASAAQLNPRSACCKSSQPFPSNLC